MSDNCSENVHKAIRALQECIQPALDVLSSNYPLTREEHILIYQAISKLQAGLKYWEHRQQPNG
jgi:hypothetical protein